MKENEPEVLLELKGIEYTYDGEERPSLQGVNLKIHRGKKIAFMGANGSGKSTLFLCCNGIYKPDCGTIYYRGEPVDYSRKGLLKLRKNVGIVFQDPDNQLFSASVYEEISFGACNIGMSEKEASAAVDQVIDLLEIRPFSEKPTYALSGGQKKQVSVADILVMQPEIIILDEPAAALDPKHTRIVRGIVDELTKKGITVMMSTHDIDYAYGWADEIVLMHEGKVLRHGNPVEVCENQELLAMTNLELPGVLCVYDSLCKKGVLKKDRQPPRNFAELQNLIEAIDETAVK